MGRIATYVRVSTEEQNPDSRRKETREYAKQNLEAENVIQYADIESGTTADREEFNTLREDIKLEDISSVVTTEVSRVARSIRDLENFIELCKTNNTAVHFTREPIQFEPDDENPYNRAMIQLLGVFAELEAKMIQQRTKEAIRHMRENGHKWGRAPLGFDKNNGNISPNEDYDRVCSILEMVDDNKTSQNKASDVLDTSRTTIRRILTDDDRRELYNLGDKDG